jgi:hypothetical protein
VPPPAAEAPHGAGATAGATEAETAAKGAEVTARTRTREGAAKDGTAAAPVAETIKPVLAVKSDKLQARKVDTWSAYYDSNDTTLAGVLADANDGIPIGFYDVESAYIGALANLVLSGDIAGIDALQTEFGSIIKKLAALTTGASDEQKAAFKAALVTQKAAQPASTTATPAPAAPAPQTASKAAETPDLTAQLATLQKSLETLTTALETSQKEAREAKEAAQKANDRATSLEQIRQTRKSVDTDEVPAHKRNSSPESSAAPAPAKKGADGRSVQQKMDDNLMGLVS